MGVGNGVFGFHVREERERRIWGGVFERLGVSRSETSLLEIGSYSVSQRLVHPNFDWRELNSMHLQYNPSYP